MHLKNSATNNMKKILFLLLLPLLSFSQLRDSVYVKTDIFEVMYSETLEQPLWTKYQVLCTGVGASRKGTDLLFTPCNFVVVLILPLLLIAYALLAHKKDKTTAITIEIMMIMQVVLNGDWALKFVFNDEVKSFNFKMEFNNYE